LAGASSTHPFDKLRVDSIQESMPTLTPSSEDVRVYEVAIMYQSDLDQKAESDLLKETAALFDEAKGRILFQDPWSKRGLAYKIRGFTEAKFVISYLEVPPENIRELDRLLRLQKGILRHLIVIPPAGYEAVSFEDRYQTWLKTRETAAETQMHKKEERLRQTVAEHAKRTTKRMESKKQAPVEPLKAKELDEQIEKLISDADLKL